MAVELDPTQNIKEIVVSECSEVNVATAPDIQQNIKELAAALLSEMGKPQVPGITVRELATLYLERHAKPHLKDWKAEETRLRLYILPAFGSAQICSITASDVLSFQASICEAKENCVRAATGGKYMANRCIQQLGQMLRLARDWGYYPEDKRIPTDKVRCFTEQSRERYVDASEMERLAKAIDRRKKTAPHLRAFFWLCLMTGLRRDELRTARWDELDLKGRQLRRAGLNTKSGKPLCQPLSADALDLLNELPRSSPYIFSAKGRDEPVCAVTIFRCWSRIRKEANLSDLRIHDLRRTVGSWLAQAGVPILLVGKTLNHRDITSTQIYARFSNADVRKALDSHSANLTAYRIGMNASPAELGKALSHRDITSTERVLPETVPAPCTPSLAKAINECAPHLRVFFWLFFMTGLSKRELLSARWQDLDAPSRELGIRAGHSHSKKAARQPLSTAALELLAFLPKHSTYIFAPPRKARAVSPPSLRDAWESICRRAQLPSLEIRTLRRTAERLMLEDGIHYDLVARVFNRKPKGATEFSQEEVREAVDLLAEKIMSLVEHTSVERL